MSTTQFTIRTIVTHARMVIPCTANQRTDLAVLPIIEAAYARYNGGRVAPHTLHLFMEAMADSGALVTLYSHNGEMTSRVLWVTSVSLTRTNDITCRAYCTYRRQIRSFRLDRILSCHPLTTPDDIEVAA